VIRPAYETKTVGTDKMKYIIVKTEQALKQTQKLTLQTIPSINTMRMGDADLRFHISTMQG